MYKYLLTMFAIVLFSTQGFSQIQSENYTFEVGPKVFYSTVGVNTSNIPDNSKVEVYNANNSKVHESEPLNDKARFKIDLSNQPLGEYTFYLVSENGDRLKKVVLTTNSKRQRKLN